LRGGSGGLWRPIDRCWNPSVAWRSLLIPYLCYYPDIDIGYLISRNDEVPVLFCLSDDIQ